jgi:hypothetical protein
LKTTSLPAGQSICFFAGLALGIGATADVSAVGAALGTGDVGGAGFFSSSQAARQRHRAARCRAFIAREDSA